ncbi:MAG TPA: LacI family DNA-binding transcriptional regulator [Thermoleophilia bacterium]|nr:LacI family DNA-binding transcriptional regulator [Thermoleophilia bacterium]
MTVPRDAPAGSADGDAPAPPAVGVRRGHRQHGVSIRDVARLAGVSPGTASRVLSGSSYPVSDRARLRVEEAARALNYVTNSAARALVTGRSEIVGAIVHDITDPFFSVVVRGLQDAAVADGLVVLVGNDDRDAGKLESYLTMLLSQKPTGVVLIGGQLRDPASTLPVALAVQRLCEQGVPIVAVGRYELDIPHVAVDDLGAAETAVSHLIELGHRQIAFLGGPLNSTTVQDRYTGYGAALTRVGAPVDERLVVQTPLTLEGGSQGVARLITDGVPFSAIFAATDEVAFGAISALREAGLRIPLDVSVVGFDDVVMSSHSDPPLTTIHVPARELGLSAWHLLKSGAVGASASAGRVPFELVVRGSTAAPGEHGPGAVVGAHPARGSAPEAD